MTNPPSGSARALAALTQAGVDFVLVGVGGINFYARTPAEAYATLDLDALLAPSAANLAAALRALHALGYRFEAGGEPFLDIDEESLLASLVRRGATLNALHDRDGQIDLMLSITGSSYSDLAGDAATFRIAESAVRVGRLEKLLAAKRASGRPKDLAFLRAFESGR